MKKKVLVGVSTTLVCCAMLFAFEAKADVDVDPADTVTLRFRKDKFVDQGIMQCVAFSLTRCEYVFGLHKVN